MFPGARITYLTISTKASAGTDYKIRVRGAAGALVNNGRVYSFTQWVLIFQSNHRLMPGSVFEFLEDLVSL
jgi:hypothetical protein